MRFYNGNDTSGDYSSGNIKLVTQISAMGATTSGTSYSLTFCGNSTSCASTVTSCTTGECIIGESVAGGTPLASALGEARTYLNAHKASDPCALCRNKFVIMVTDGNDTYACSGGGSECESYSYERRREVVARAKALKNAGYSVFVVGFGTSMPIYLQNTLNWAAYYGGTDNPSVANSGDVTAYNIPADGTSVYPTAVAAAGTAAGNCGSAGGATSACCTTSGNDVTDVCGGLTFYKSISNFASSANDPGFLNLSGYAFLASNSDELTAALKTAMNIIRESTYSFTTASVQSVRLNDTSNYENYLYEANFEPLSSDPFWIGHLKRYSIQTNGDIPTTSDWDAGVVLKNTDASARTIKTIVTSATLEDFLTTNSHLTDALLGVSSNTTCTGLCTSVINFIRGGDVNYGPSATDYAWKLGDVFHSSPVSVATPNINYVDTNDTSATKGFDAYRSSHIRTSSNKLRIIVVGANDGQLHAFRAGDLASSSSTTSGGSEAWSFIPPNQLYRLHYVNHTAHPDPELKRHKYFVDGPLSASEVWVGSGGTVGSTAKVSTDWRTYLVVAEGRGGMATLWSSQATCTSGFSASYSSTYPFYCGYYALDVTNTLSPQYVWKLGGNSYGLDDADGLYLGQAWSKLLLNRVRINSIERHVGFFGGGYSGAVSTGSGSAVTNTAGKGFFVLDSKTGEILWRFTRANDARMVYDLAGDAGLFDSDNDGFIDLAYIGDTGGNIWRFTFCKAKDGDTCDTSDWSGSLLFNNH
jgi:hypothetical protein